LQQHIVAWIMNLVNMSISHPSLVIYLYFANPTQRKLKHRTAYTWELLIANHLDQSLLCLANQKQGSEVRTSYLLHSSLVGAQL
jgi:hypothetical protein